MQNMWTDNSSTAYSSAEAVKQERIFMIYCCYISKGYKVNNVITFSCPCLWAATNCIWQWPSLPPSLDWETLSWQSPHFQRLKTLFQILNLPLALETFTFKGRSLSAILNTHGSFSLITNPKVDKAALNVSYQALADCMHPYKALSNSTIIAPFFNSSSSSFNNCFFLKIFKP